MNEFNQRIDQNQEQDTVAPSLKVKVKNDLAVPNRVNDLAKAEMKFKQTLLQ